VRVNGLDALIVTKLDVLDAFDEIQVLERYELDGTPLDRLPPTARALERVRPTWRRFPGWKTSTRAARRWCDLPAEARAYLEWLERTLDVPLASVSVGAERDAEVPRT